MNRDCSGFNQVCVNGRCSNRRPHPPRPRPPRPPMLHRPPRPVRPVNVNVKVTHVHRPTHHVIQRPPLPPPPPPRPSSVNGYQLVKGGNGAHVVPENAPCPLFSRPTDRFDPVLKCNRIFCRCKTTSDCLQYKPWWSSGHLQCCGQSCVLGLADSCLRDARVCV